MAKAILFGAVRGHMIFQIGPPLLFYPFIWTWAQLPGSVSKQLTYSSNEKDAFFYVCWLLFQLFLNTLLILFWESVRAMSKGILIFGWYKLIAGLYECIYMKCLLPPPPNKQVLWNHQLKKSGE